MIDSVLLSMASELPEVCQLNTVLNSRTLSLCFSFMKGAFITCLFLSRKGNRKKDFKFYNYLSLISFYFLQIEKKKGGKAEEIVGSPNLFLFFKGSFVIIISIYTHPNLNFTKQSRNILVNVEANCIYLRILLYSLKIFIWRFLFYILVSKIAE